MGLFYFCNHCNRKYKNKDKLVKHVYDSHGQILNPDNLNAKEYGKNTNKKEYMYVSDRKQKGKQKISYSTREVNDNGISNKLCSICEDAEIDVIYLPCGHISSCGKCANFIYQNHKICPVCRADIRKINKIYISV
jgi:hypothetical protein